MANSSVKILDTNNRVVYKFIGDAAETRTIKIDAGSLNFAMNANNYILGAGTDRKPKYRLNLRRLVYNTFGGPIVISSDGDAAGQNILQVSGDGSMIFDEGAGFVIDCAANANTTGNIFVGTQATGGNVAYTLIADFRKNPADYDQGQTADPTAFNRGPAAGGGFNPR